MATLTVVLLSVVVVPENGYAAEGEQHNTNHKKIDFDSHRVILT